MPPSWVALKHGEACWAHGRECRRSPRTVITPGERHSQEGVAVLAPGNWAPEMARPPLTCPPNSTSSEWLAHHTEEQKEQVAPLADCLAPCGMVVSQCRPWGFRPLPERLPSSGGPTPPTVGAPPTGRQEWASAGPGASTCPYGSGVVGVDGALVQAGVGGSVLLFGPERDPPANATCSLPLKV